MLRFDLIRFWVEPGHEALLVCVDLLGLLGTTIIIDILTLANFLVNLVLDLLELLLHLLVVVS